MTTVGWRSAWQQEAAHGVEQPEARALVVLCQQRLGPGAGAEDRDQAGQQPDVAGFAVDEVRRRFQIGRAAQHLQPRPERGRAARLEARPHSTARPRLTVPGGLPAGGSCRCRARPSPVRPRLAHARPVDGRGSAAPDVAWPRTAAGGLGPTRGAAPRRSAWPPSPAAGETAGTTRTPPRRRSGCGRSRRPPHGCRAGTAGGGGQQLVVAVDDAALQGSRISLPGSMPSSDPSSRRTSRAAPRASPAGRHRGGPRPAGPSSARARARRRRAVPAAADLAVAAEGEQGVGAPLLGHAVEAAPVVGGLLDPAGARELGQRVAATAPAAWSRAATARPGRARRRRP
jgi:hypothetical protein